MKILLAIWMLPQTLIYGIVYLLIKNAIVSKKTYKVCGIDVNVYATKDHWLSNMGLGFGAFYLVRSPEDEAEEFGHCVQSFYLGWLFIPAWLLSFGYLDKWAQKLGEKYIKG